MASATLVPVSEYLKTTYHPDCDFLNGSLRDLQERVNDYFAIGVAHIWAIDPLQRIGYVASPRGFIQPEDGTLRIPNTPISITLADVFTEMDEM